MFLRQFQGCLEDPSLSELFRGPRTLLKSGTLSVQVCELKRPGPRRFTVTHRHVAGRVPREASQHGVVGGARGHAQRPRLDLSGCLDRRPRERVVMVNELRVGFFGEG